MTHVHRRVIHQVDGTEDKEHHEQQTQQSTAGEKMSTTDNADQQEIASYDIYEGATKHTSSSYVPILDQPNCVTLKQFTIENLEEH